MAEETVEEGGSYIKTTLYSLEACIFLKGTFGRVRASSLVRIKVIITLLFMYCFLPLALVVPCGRTTCAHGLSRRCFPSAKMVGFRHEIES